MTRDRARLLHIRDAIERIREYAPTREKFLGDARTQDAVVRNLEIIGEAVKSLSDATTAAAPDAHWSAIAGMRDRLIHGYFAVDLDLVWDVVARDLGPLSETVERLLGNH